ncbi:osteopetrosis-associated transmembrane protein 1 [Colossoma macropomum]|uniref:osteopetrosis-associated transmembrane protein 1 n=1 Tax=Colossoma macropomum TaxID=42526 RepID=UPI001864F9E3|nr:osteopetrosis-associated transmembrane protein 1 [Colossoma macropomum]
MRCFALCGRALCLLLWGSALALIGPLNLSVLAAESSQTKPPSFLSLQEKGLDGLGYFDSLGLAAKFPGDLEVTEDCLKLLQVFGQRYVDLVNCLISSARPVEVCQNCYGAYSSFNETYSNITDTMGPKNTSCQDSLMQSDRLMLLYNLYSSLEDIWGSADCTSCLTKDHKSLLNSTLNFISSHNSTLSCFEKYQGNHSKLCTECKVTYKRLNELYSNLEKNVSLCIDIEDAMNVTRRLWSKYFNCSVPREETVPVIAVSSFMLFLPVIFYLSNFLHSEQKKRKLIHPKRAKSNHSLMNIQDKFS